jgi:hypothetical protein
LFIGRYCRRIAKSIGATATVTSASLHEDEDPILILLKADDGTQTKAESRERRK